MLTETITWRPVADGLPDAELCVLIACDTKFHSEPVWIGFHDGEAWREANGEPAFVTHWAQLPAAPAGVGAVHPQQCNCTECQEMATRLMREAAAAAGVTACPNWPTCSSCLGCTPTHCADPAAGVAGTPAPSPLTDAARVLAEFAKTAPGRLPQRVQDAIEVVALGVTAPALADQLFDLAGRIRDLPDGVLPPAPERDQFLHGFAQGHRAARIQAAGLVEDASRGVAGTQGDKP